ncbi:MAG: hypothetical protein PHR01_05350, partial [Sphaerochaetaceae bacterium]|nr:hypothetical protein [Sphaerochaetaceae bacterium]
FLDVTIETIHIRTIKGRSSLLPSTGKFTNFAQIPFRREVEGGLLFIRSVDVFDTGEKLEVFIDLPPIDLAIFLLSRL